MKNNKLIICLLVMFLGARLQAQDETITKELRPFFEVKAFDGISVNLIPSTVNKAVIRGDRSDKVSIVNNSGVLKVRMQIDRIFGGYQTFVDVYFAEELRVLDVNEDAQIKSDTAFQQEVLEIKAQEGGNITLECQVTQLLVKAVSGGEIFINGKAKNQDIVINTGGHYKAKDFLTEYTTVKVNAGGRAEIYSTDYVGASVKAGGRIYVYGDPLKMDEKKVFGGTIERVD